jgi:4-amino-4-deoxy-L-arabinose transferase-like glycosyltransferase
VIARRAWKAPTAVAIVAFGLSFMATIPSLNALINWDNGAYIASIASGKQTWSGSPGYWNAHLGILHAYLIGCVIARSVGGTVIDGFRITTAFFYAATCTILFFAARKLTDRILVAIAFAALWATAWVNFHYLLILEDNPLFLAPASGVICVCALRADDWRIRDSVLAGVLACGAFLASWQAVPYLFPPMYAALLSTTSSRRDRVLSSVLVLASAIAALLAWICFVAATSTNSLASLTHTVFSRPEPSGLPRSSAEMLQRVIAFRSMFETLGNSVAYHVTFNAYRLPLGPPLPFIVLGALAALITFAIAIASSVWSWRTRRPAPHVLAVTLLLFSYVTALYHDVSYTALKRFDFVPLLVVALLMLAFAELQHRRPSKDGGTIIALVMLAFSVVQLGFGLRWTIAQRKSYVATMPWGQVGHSPSMYDGRDGKSWFDYFRNIRRAHPDACRYVFAMAELHDGNWNLDITGALWSELPNHLAILSDDQVSKLRPEAWRYPIQTATVSAAMQRSLLPSCAWTSEAAQELLK